MTKAQIAGGLGMCHFGSSFPADLGRSRPLFLSLSFALPPQPIAAAAKKAVPTERIKNRFTTGASGANEEGRPRKGTGPEIRNGKIAANLLLLCRFGRRRLGSAAARTLAARRRAATTEGERE